MFCVTSALGISWQHLNHPNLLVRSGYRFHVYFHVRLILHELSIFFPHEDGFSNVKNAYIRSAYYSICDDLGVEIKHGCMGIGVIQQIMLFLVMKQQKDLHQTTLHNELLHNQKVLPKKALKR